MTVASPTACLLALAEQIFSAAPELSAGGSNPASAAAPASPRFPDLLGDLFASDEPAAFDPDQPAPAAGVGGPLQAAGLGTALLSVVLPPTPPSAAPAMATPNETPRLQADPGPAAGEAIPPVALPATVPAALPVPILSAAPRAMAIARQLPATPEPFIAPADSNAGDPPAVLPLLSPEPKQLPASNDAVELSTAPEPALRRPYSPFAATVSGQALRQPDIPVSTPVSFPRDPQLPQASMGEQQLPEEAPAPDLALPEVEPVQTVTITPRAENAVSQPASPHATKSASHPTVADVEHRSLPRPLQNRFTPPAPELNFDREPASGNPDQTVPGATVSTLETVDPQQLLTSEAVPQWREESRPAAGQRRSVATVQSLRPQNAARLQIALPADVPAPDPASALVSPLRPALPAEDPVALPSVDKEDRSTAGPRNAIPARSETQPASNIIPSPVPSQWTPPPASAPVEIGPSPERPTPAVSDVKLAPIGAQSRPAAAPAAVSAAVPDVRTAASDIATPPPQRRAPAPLAVAGRLVPIEARDQFFSAAAPSSESVPVPHTAQSASRVRSFEPAEALKPTVESAPKATAGARRELPAHERVAPVATRREPADEERTAPEEPSDTPAAGRPRPRDVEAPAIRIQEPAPQSQPGRTESANSLTAAQPSADRPVDRNPVSPEPVERPTHTELPAMPDAAKAPVSARNIRLEMAAGEQRVEVQVVERGGNVHMAVRTPDPHLSDALRENLPDLSARLEQTGYRAESWHTPADPRRDTETVRGLSEPNPQSQPDGRRRDDAQPRPDDFEQPRNRKQKGNEFEWFMASLRG